MDTSNVPEDLLKLLGDQFVPAESPAEAELKRDTTDLYQMLLRHAPGALWTAGDVHNALVALQFKFVRIEDELLWLLRSPSV
ncbi:MAG: hypothetical protein JNL05_12895 [Flavobacteriales bacterium]|nr:hypothetical protein [Flavobacteriales bacterium]